ncbi:MAG: helix-hairpin-helix domain-containing protein [Alphaproteobacteria bacterium]|nr:helix-hairpin-helix domain-containing protein [Alphaproteobacteria bacterium]
MKQQWLIGTLILAAGLSPATGQPSTGAEATTPEQAIGKVCTSCHGLEVVMDTPRDYNAWHDTVQSMIDRGANGTQDEFGLVMEFLFENMTPVDVNHGDAEALQAVLHATPEQAAAIIAHRKKRPFKDLADLKAAVPGLNGSLLDAKKRMIFFQ